jgi:hypothetical protein
VTMHIFDQIIFDEPTHTYTLDGKPLTSVSRTLDRVKAPFDRELIAGKMARKSGRPVADILAEWEEKGRLSREKGERVHAHIERVLKGQQDDDPFLALNTLLPEEKAFNSFWESDARKLLTLERAEWIVGDAELGIGGRLDALFYSPKTQKRHIWDWKTGSKFRTSNQWDRMLEPFGDLDDCELQIYSLQASLYRLIVERGTGEELGDSYILYLGPDGHLIHRAIDYRARLLAWLTS